MKLMRIPKVITLAGFLALTVMCSPASGIDLSEGLIAYWPLEAGAGPTAYDLAGTHDGTLQGGVVWVEGELDDFALDFHGQGDCVYIESSAGTNSDLNIYNSDMTISAWVKSRAGGTVLARAKPHYITYRLAAGPTHACLNVYVSPTHFNFCSGYVMVPDTWHHLVGVFDRVGNKGYLYVDGVLEAFGEMPDTPGNNDGLTKLGCRNGVDDYPFDGTLDDLAMWNRALSAQEVLKLFLAGETPLFEDGFESGDTSAWSSTVP